MRCRASVLRALKPNWARLKKNYPPCRRAGRRKRTSWLTVRKPRRRWKQRASNWSRCNAVASWSAPANWLMALFPNWNSSCAHKTKPPTLKTVQPCWNRRSMKTTLPRWCRAGRAFRSIKCWRANARNFWIWSLRCMRAWWARNTPCLRWRALYAASVQACKTRRGHPAAFCFWGPRVSARPS